MPDTNRDPSTGLAKQLSLSSGHLCLIYNDEKQRRKIVSEYLSAGLRQGEKVRYFADVATLDDVRGWLLEMGVELPETPANQVNQVNQANQAFTVVRAEAGYCPAGHFEPKKMIDGSTRQYELAKQAGFTGLRSTGEMSWVLKGIPGSDRFLEYEALLNTIKTDFPHVGMCQYDSRLFDGATLARVLRVHPLMVAEGQIVNNPFYTRPEELGAESISVG